MAIVSYFGHLNAPMPIFNITEDRLHLFVIGEVTTTQVYFFCNFVKQYFKELSYVLCTVPIMLRAKTTVNISETTNGTYSFKIEVIFC